MSNKKLTILSIILIIAIGAGVFWYVNREVEEVVVEDEKNESQESEVEKEENHPLEGVFEKPEEFEAEIVFNEEVDVSDWIFYENEVYSLYYPKELELIKNPLDGEADNWFKYEVKDEYPIISVNYEDYSDIRFNYKKQLRIKNNKEIKVVQVGSSRGWYTEGASNEKVINGQTVYGKLYGKSLFFMVNDKIIGIGLAYELGDEEIVEIFNQIMSTVKFK